MLRFKLSQTEIKPEYNLSVSLLSPGSYENENAYAIVVKTQKYAESDNITIFTKDGKHSYTTQISNVSNPDYLKWRTASFSVEFSN